MSFLVFLDSNIWLDFYRLRTGGVRVGFLESIEEHKDRIITTTQVEMEYKKNRQHVILETLQGMKGARPEKGFIPPIVAEAQTGQTLNKRVEAALDAGKKVHERVEKILSDPIHYDPVYQSFQRVFRKHKSPFSLTRDMPERRLVRSRAWRRFMLGYPPRKKNDTSIGDAINWEWIVKCSQDSGNDVVVVTRDTDFGPSFNGNMIVNDWLLDEFKDRVSRKRKIILTNKLTDGLKHLKVRAKKEFVKAEDEVIKERETQSQSVSRGGISSEQWDEVFEALYRDLNIGGDQ